MVDKTELILICLVAVALLAIVARKIRVPYPILLTIGGVVLALVPGLPAIHLEPELVFNLFLPPLLYPAAVYTSWRDFRANLRSILPLAIFGSADDGSDRLPISWPNGTAFGCWFRFRRPYLATRRHGRLGGDERLEGAAQDHCHPRRREPGKRCHVVHLFPFRGGGGTNRELFAGAGEP